MPRGLLLQSAIRAGHPMAIHIIQAASIAKENLDPLGPVNAPLSSPVPQLVGRQYPSNELGIDGVGIWECSPGRWQRTIMLAEFAHFIKGSARFIPDGGVPIDIRAGDTIWFPANSRGIWEINEDVRKVYVIIHPPSLLRILKFRTKKILANWGIRKQTPSAAKPACGAIPATASLRTGVPEQ